MTVCCEPTIQKGSTDCGLAALAMAIGVPYREVSDESRKLNLKAHKVGLYTVDMLKLAKRLGHPMRKVRGVCETGVLIVGRGKKQAHAVTMFCGVLVNPADGLLWELESYLATGKWKVLGSLEEIK